MSENLQEIIDRVKADSRDEVDIRAITAAIAAGQLILANAPESVSIGENVSGSQIVMGHGNVMGDRSPSSHLIKTL